MKVEVNFDKMIKELAPILSYKYLVTLKRRLEGWTLDEIRAEQGLTFSSSISNHLAKIREVLGIEANPYVADLFLAMLCYERGYVVLIEKEEEK